MKNAQDQYCSKALSGNWDGLGAFPSELALEALVDILRGKVKVGFILCASFVLVAYRVAGADALL
jgi:hypothetical protein